MRKLRPGSVVKIEHKGQAENAIVDNMQPDPRFPRFVTVAFHVSGKFEENEMIDVLTEREKLSGRVLEICRQDETLSIKVLPIKC
jgi:hypothetical protein